MIKTALMTHFRSRRPPNDLSVERTPDVFHMSSLQLHCDTMILGGGHAAAGVIVVVSGADIAIEAAPAAIAAAEEVIRAKVGQ